MVGQFESYGTEHERVGREMRDRYDVPNPMYSITRKGAEWAQRLIHRSGFPDYMDPISDKDQARGQVLELELSMMSEMMTGPVTLDDLQSEILSDPREMIGKLKTLEKRGYVERLV